MTCGCAPLLQCYRNTNSPGIVRRARVNPFVDPPEWRDVQTNAIVPNANIIAASCSEQTPAAVEFIPQFINVQRAVLDPGANVRFNRWSPANQNPAFGIGDIRRYSEDDPFWGAPVRSKRPGATHSQTNELRALNYQINLGSGGELEQKDFWYLFPADVIGVPIQIQAVANEGNTRGPSIFSNDSVGASPVGAWTGAINAAVFTVTPLEYDPCLTALGFTARRFRGISGDEYYIGGSAFRWRVVGDLTWINAANNRARPTLTEQTYPPMNPLFSLQTVSRAKDGFGNVINPAGVIVTGEVCYNPPYASWPEPVAA